MVQTNKVYTQRVITPLCMVKYKKIKLLMCSYLKLLQVLRYGNNRWVIMETRQNQKLFKLKNSLICY